MVKVIVQPRDGIEPLLEAIRQAEEFIELTIYRADRLEIEQELVEAAARGVQVHVLTTTTNRDDFKNLRKLETRLASTGVQVSQTAQDLIRYHNKMMIIDRRMLYLLTFNFTFLDIHHSRSFGVIIDDPVIVAEAHDLFDADAARRRQLPDFHHLIVSPLNARERIAAFIRGARQQLLIYDNRLTDAQIIRLLVERARAGVEVKVIGAVNKNVREFPVQPMPAISLHAQTMIRDGEAVFLGSQSLRKAELDDRREVGLVVMDPEAVNHFLVIFELDWGDIIKR
jgi:phosphatidylserine/phosphatidylglycerophosphate/cardiolipin synthase-like enzyme